MTCDYHCNPRGWLPVDGTRDAVTDDNGETLLLLYPTEFVMCPCNPLAAVNDDLRCEVLDVWRCEAVTEMAR